MLVIDLNMKNDFKKARFRLVVLYLFIIGGVIGIFSSLIIYQTRDSFSDPAVPTDANTVLNAGEAQLIAQGMRPGKNVIETEYEIEDGMLYFTVGFGDEDEIKVNLLEGDIFIPEKDERLIEMLTDDFEEKVGWIALLVFALAALLSVYVANKTLNPILHNIRAQKQFVAGAAHELRNPLSALQARIESTLLSPSGELKEEVLKDLLAETQHLIEVSEGLLFLEKGENKQPHIEPQSVQNALNKVKSRLAYLAENKQVVINENIATETLNIDREDLDTILYNLIHNAIKFTDSSGYVQIDWIQHTLTVTDTGIGITEEDIPHVFNRFYKGDILRGSIGSGLGLSLVKEIADRYKARIHISSQTGKGTTVSIIFN